MGAMKKYAKLSQDFEKKHEEFKQHMQLLKCYEYHSQWATGSGVGFGSAGAVGKHLTRMRDRLHEDQVGASLRQHRWPRPLKLCVQEQAAAQTSPFACAASLHREVCTGSRNR